MPSEALNTGDPTDRIADGMSLPAHTWRYFALLFLINITWSIDRAVPSIVAEQIKQDFDLSDGQLGLFTGLAYGISFGIGAIIAGPIIDRYHRAKLLAALVAAWSGLTALGGFVSSYAALIATRVGVGASEAGGEPAALSIISDLFPARRRATAIGIFKIGTPIGLLLASSAGGYITAHYGWRAAFLFAGVPGIILAIMAWRWLPDPPRGQFEHPGTARPPLRLREVLQLITGSGAIAFLMMGAILFYFSNSGPTAFMVAYLQRVHGVSLIVASNWYGVASAVGMAGPLIAGIYADRLIRGGIHRSIRLLAVIALLNVAAGMIMILSNNMTIIFPAMIIWFFLALSLSTPLFAILLTLSPPEGRGTMTALLLICMYFLGIGSGPFATGVISDLLGGGNYLRHALLILLSLNIGSVAMFLWSARKAQQQASLPHADDFRKGAH